MKVADKTTKFLLAAIALGLWANAIGTWWPSAQVSAQDNGEGAIVAMQSNVAAIRADVSALTSGFCINRRICDRAEAAIESQTRDSRRR